MDIKQLIVIALKSQVDGEALELVTRFFTDAKAAPNMSDFVKTKLQIIYPKKDLKAEFIGPGEGELTGRRKQ